MQGSADERSKDTNGLGFGRGQGNTAQAANPLPSSLLLSPTCRWPTRLPEATVQAVMARPVPAAWRQGPNGPLTARASIVIVTYNSLVYTKLCLESVLSNTDYPNYEILVVDNGSNERTTSYLRDLQERQPCVRVIYNARNLGFAAANNQGMALATGDVFLLLNNDTLVPPGWLGRLVRYLEDWAIGLVGPVTNRCGNEAQIDVPYRTYGEFLQFAGEYSQKHIGQAFDIRMLAMFCAAMRRDLHERVGPLDERFELGLFEDDDYAVRVRRAGYRVVCAEDAFVHHFGQASLGRLNAGAYGELFHANRRRWEEKWQTLWQPYRRRTGPAYRKLTERIRAAVDEAVPSSATVLVVSRGDDELLQLQGRPAWHFPSDADGGYAGYHPADSAEAIAQLEMLRARGASFLLVPSTALWWLDYYGEFARHLVSRYREVLREQDTCLIFALGTAN
jgi:GT2 family glycosyltransferase